MSEALQPLATRLDIGIFERLRDLGLWRGLAWVGWIALLSIAALLAYFGARKRVAARKSDDRHARSQKTWKRLQELVRDSGRLNGVSEGELHEAYESLCSVVYDAIDRSCGVGARSHPRSELKRLLVGEQGLPEPTWDRISSLLEFAETVRFASRAGAVTSDRALTQLPKWVEEASRLEEALGRHSPPQPGPL